MYVCMCVYSYNLYLSQSPSLSIETRVRHGSCTCVARTTMKMLRGPKRSRSRSPTGSAVDSYFGGKAPSTNDTTTSTSARVDKDRSILIVMMMMLVRRRHDANDSTMARAYCATLMVTFVLWIQ